MLQYQGFYYQHISNLIRNHPSINLRLIFLHFLSSAMFSFLLNHKYVHYVCQVTLSLICILFSFVIIQCFNSLSWIRGTSGTMSDHHSTESQTKLTSARNNFTHTFLKLGNSFIFVVKINEELFTIPLLGVLMLSSNS